MPLTIYLLDGDENDLLVASGSGVNATLGELSNCDRKGEATECSIGRRSNSSNLCDAHTVPILPTDPILQTRVTRSQPFTKISALR